MCANMECVNTKYTVCVCVCIVVPPSSVIVQLKECYFNGIGISMFQLSCYEPPTCVCVYSCMRSVFILKSHILNAVGFLSAFLSTVWYSH